MARSDFLPQSYLPFSAVLLPCARRSLFNIQSTPVISNSKGLTETLRDIQTLTYQS